MLTFKSYYDNILFRDIVPLYVSEIKNKDVISDYIVQKQSGKVTAVKGSRTLKECHHVINPVITLHPPGNVLTGLLPATVTEVSRHWWNHLLLIHR